MKNLNLAYSTEATDELMPSHELADGKYTIQRVNGLSESGFNYTALNADGSEVSIREFFLSDICYREGSQIKFQKRSDGSLFRKLVNGFIDDARYLKSLENPHIALVSDVFEENGTAYMVSTPPNGQTLEDLFAEGREFKPVEVARMANQLFSALIEIHTFGMLHRDINPKNIKVTENSDAVLLADFSTFREDKSKVSKVVSSVLRAQSVYAPIEFIFEGSEQNEASDVYSVAAILYQMMTGKPPVTCQDRLAAVGKGDPDPYVSVAQTHPRYDSKFLMSIDLSLALLNENRVRSATEFLSCFVRGASDVLRLQSEAMDRRPKKRGFLSFIKPRKIFSLFRR
ncbi:MAG: protein kinase [Pseudomonadota bacterium]